jgi:hypothetical protein
MGTERMTPRYVFHKPFKVYFSNKHEWQNRLNPDNREVLVWYTDGSKTNEGTGAEVCKWGSKRGTASVSAPTPWYSRRIYMPSGQV